jgi:predicted enzyme related to lactoylglutathione lyase
MTTNPAPVQMRLVIHSEDLDAALTFYRDTLGLPVELEIESDGDARVVVLDAGRATFELINTPQRHLIDQLEVGRDVSRAIRVAFEVADARASTNAVVTIGAELVGAPTMTPWGSLNARIEGPDGVQLTLFEQVEPE